MKTLRVKPHIALPYKVQYGEHGFATFTPDAELPDDVADAFLASHPNRYETAKGAANPDSYKWKKDFEDRALAEEIARLSDDDKGKIFKFIDELNQKADAKAKKALVDEEAGKQKELNEKASADLQARKADEREKERQAKAAKPSTTTDK